MKHLKMLACVAALASLALFTGCGGDDNGPSTSPAPTPTGTNAPATITGETITADNGDSVTADDNTNYHATFASIAEKGTYTYVPNGSDATLSLSPTDGSASSTIALTFNADGKSGNYTLQETGQSGTFTMTP